MVLTFFLRLREDTHFMGTALFSYEWCNKHRKSMRGGANSAEGGITFFRNLYLYSTAENKSWPKSQLV